MMVENSSLVEDQSSTSRAIIAKDKAIVINSSAKNSTSESPQLQESSSDSDFDHLTIKERAFWLQLDLFGISSV